jgi:hypothetical protein
MGMNNLLGAGTEFVCSDGRMSVNGICKTPEQAIQPVQPITASPVQDNNGSDDNRKTSTAITGGKNLNDYQFDKNVKSTFEWDFDKVGNKIQDFGNTVKDNITAYDKYVGEKFGISSKSITLNRAGASAVTLGQGGSLLQAAGPWGLAYGIGAFVKKKIQEPIRDTMSFKDPNTVDFSSGGDSWTDDKSQSQGFGSDAASMSNVSNEGASGSFTTDFSKD